MPKVIEPFHAVHEVDGRRDGHHGAVDDGRGAALAGEQRGAEDAAVRVPRQRHVLERLGMLGPHALQDLVHGRRFLGENPWHGLRTCFLPAHGERIGYHQVVHRAVERHLFDGAHVARVGVGAEARQDHEQGRVGAVAQLQFHRHGACELASGACGDGAAPSERANGAGCDTVAASAAGAAMALPACAATPARLSAATSAAPEAERRGESRRIPEGRGRGCHFCNGDRTVSSRGCLSHNGDRTSPPSSRSRLLPRALHRTGEGGGRDPCVFVRWAVDRGRHRGRRDRLRCSPSRGRTGRAGRSWGVLGGSCAQRALCALYSSSPAVSTPPCAK